MLNKPELTVSVTVMTTPVFEQMFSSEKLKLGGDDVKRHFFRKSSRTGEKQSTMTPGSMQMQLCITSGAM